MNRRRSRWVGGIVALLVAGLLVTSLVGADDRDDRGKNPFAQILAKLDQILAAVNGGNGAGNHTLRWDTVQPAATRFVVLTDFASAAVLDRETGLVWEKSPDIATHVWNNAGAARGACANRVVGGRKGWRLPSVVELASLVDPGQTNPSLSLNHPFTNVQSGPYWSATAAADSPQFAWIVGFFNGFVDNFGKASPIPVWCVRGPMNADQY